MNKYQYDPQEEMNAQAQYLSTIQTIQSMIKHCENEPYKHIYENCSKLMQEGH